MLLPGAPIVSCLKAFFGSFAPVPVGQIYRTDTLARQRVGLDDVVGEKDRTQLRVWHRLVEGKKPLATVVSQRLKKGGCSRKN